MYSNITLGFPKVIDLLIKNGANVNFVDNDCKTPLHFAVETGNLFSFEIY